MVQKKRQNTVISIIFLIYIAVLLRITVFRSGFGPDGLFQNGNINLTIFAEYVPMLQNGQWFRFIYLFVGNIVWFVPLGMYLEYGKKAGSLWKILFWGLLFSLMIETLQYVFGTGVSELDDLVLNTLGCVCGAVFVRILRWIGKLRQ